MSEELLFAEFETANALRDAVARMRERSVEPIEVDSPYPVPGIEEILGLRRSRLPAVVFVCGVAGGISGLLIQWFTNAWDYPLNVGGRPLLSWPAWVPVTFELTVLGAAIGAVIGLFVATGLPRLWHRAFEVDGFERVTTDRFWLTIGTRDVDVTSITRQLQAAGASRIVMFEEEKT